MTAKKIVFVVGAGASCDFGLPSGAQLKTQIANYFDYAFDWDNLRSGDYIIFEALRGLSAENADDIKDVNDYVNACRHIRRAMPQAISIDNFLDAHLGNTAIERAGKLGIARAILNAEEKSGLYLDSRDRAATLDFPKLQGTWLDHCFKVITEGCRARDLEQRFSSVAFVVFNYDRCVEHFLLHALQNYYQLGQDAAKACLRNTSFFHPYGTVGFLPWFTTDQSRAVAYGEPLERKRLVDVAQELKTFTEGTDPSSSDILALRSTVTKAKKLVFLGFAYQQQNMALLFEDEVATVPHSNTRRIFGTTFGFSLADQADIAAELGRRWRALSSNIHLNRVKCGALFEEYQRGISLVR